MRQIAFCILSFYRRYKRFSTYETITGNDSMESNMAATTNSQTRFIYFNNSMQKNEKFASNIISTCKYSVFTFLFRFLIEQFRRYNNIFFLIIALLQQIPDVSPTGRYTTAVPFLIILSISAVKEIFEDIKRRKSDQKVNNFQTRILRNGKWERKRWKHVIVGDILRIENEELFPADMILLSSSEPQAMAYIETSNLDGETNLKIRQGLSCTADFTSLQSVASAKFAIECEKPNRFVNEFNGTLHMQNLHRPLRINQLLLRGARLKNTQWICGAVIYTGHDAKLLMNSKTAPLKRSNVDVMTNRRIIFLFFVLVALAIISAFGALLFDNVWLVNAYYLGLEGSQRSTFFWNVLAFFILYNNLIPISLQVTLELVRFFQASYINNDLQMYDEATDTPAVARTSNLNEELGQVKFVMCDKTGTLTRNVMKFKRCSVAGMNFGKDDEDDFDDPSLIECLQTSSENTTIAEFLRMMAICHTVVPEKGNENGIIYQASSPDEGALVRGAASLGFIFHTRKPEFVVINAMGKEEIYEILNILEFTSDRKRMGVIVRCPDSTIRLYIKGADSVLFDRIRGDSPYKDKCVEHLIEYASKGYRTLCFATRIIEDSEYRNWSADFEAASLAIDNRGIKMADCAELIEKELILVGASAIEDKLQQQVPETIKALMDAEIRIWMLTGDKRETAVNIAFSAALCNSESIPLCLDTTTYNETISRLTTLIKHAEMFRQSDSNVMLIIESTSLHYALTGDCRPLLGELALLCHSVICCRMTPMQKAEIVELVRSCGEHVVLAIGDGANDVAMIQAANVGVGISGEEGLQAASASDYSISQFHFLRRLILVHGTWNFDRCVKVIFYSFYKNICLYLIELWFALFSAFSGQTVFERWTIGLFNVAFTALPPIILGLFDRPIADSTIQKFPALYFSFHERAFSIKQFAFWISMAVWHSLILYFFSFLFMYNSTVWGNGRDAGWLMLGNSCYTFVVATVCFKALLECDSWTHIILYSIVGSIALWFLFLAIYSALWPFIPLGDDMTGMAYIMISSPNFWLAFFLIPLFALLFDFIFKVIRITVSPTPRELLCIKEYKSRDRVMELSGIGTSSNIGDIEGFANEALSIGTSASNNSPVQSADTHESLFSSTLPCEICHIKPCVDNARLLDDTINEIMERTDQHGYAFSQEEGGVVSQSDVVRRYDSTKTKPYGL